MDSVPEEPAPLWAASCSSTPATHSTLSLAERAGTETEETGTPVAAVGAASFSAAVSCLPQAEGAARVFPACPVALESGLPAIRLVRQVTEAVAVAELLVEEPRALPLLSNRRKRDPSLAVALGPVVISGVDQAGATAEAEAAATMAAGEVAALPVEEAAATSLIKGAVAAIRM
jgi:hypothetical protein